MRDETEARIFLTFDDGPDPIWTPRILEALHRSQARATFSRPWRCVFLTLFAA